MLALVVEEEVLGRRIPASSASVSSSSLLSTSPPLLPLYQGRRLPGQPLLPVRPSAPAEVAEIGGGWDGVVVPDDPSPALGLLPAAAPSPRSQSASKAGKEAGEWNVRRFHWPPLFSSQRHALPVRDAAPLPAALEEDPAHRDLAPSLAVLSLFFLSSSSLLEEVGTSSWMTS